MTVFVTPLSSCTKLILIAVVGLSISACQPTPEERFARAESYYAEAEYRSAVIELKNVLQSRPDFVPARRLLADASYILADFETAESYYRRVLELGETEADVWQAYGRTLLADGRAAEALEKVVPELEVLIDDESAAVLLGDIYSALGNSPDAEDRYQRALTLNPSSAGGMIGRAYAALANGDDALAGEILESAVRQHPDAAQVLRANADFLHTGQKYSEAAEYYRRAIAAQDSKTPYAERYLVRQNLVATLIESGRFDEATQQLNRFARMVPTHPGVTFFRGHIAFGEGDHELAESEMLKYLARVPGDARAQAILGAINFRKNNLGQAEQYLSYAVRSKVGGDSMRVLLAETQLRLDRPDQALSSLRETSSERQSDALVLAMLGRAKLGEGSVDEAIDFFEQSVSRGAQSASVNLALAASYIKTGLTAEAIELLGQMATGSDGDFRREMLLMVAYMESGDSAAAAALAERLTVEHSDDPNAHALAGALYHNLGDQERGDEQLEKALVLDSTNLGALYLLAAVAAAELDLDKAATLFERLLDEYPAHLPSLVQLTSILQRSNRIGGIERRIEAARGVSGDSVALYSLGVQVKLLQGRVSDAESEIERARKAYPEESALLHLDGVVKLESGDIRAAITSLSRAAKADPTNAGYLFDLARARLAHGDFSQAAAVARDYRALRPADILGLAIEVDAELRGGDPSRARRSVDEFAESHPDAEFVSMLYGDIAFSGGDSNVALSWYEKYAQANWNQLLAIRLAGAHQAAGTGKAVQTIERWVEENPDDATSRRIYGQLLEAAGDLDAAIAEYEQLEKRGEIDAIGLNNLAWHYSQKGLPGAVELAERASDLAPGNGDVSDTLGWILYRSGDLTRAKETLLKAVAQSPRNPEVKYHLAMVLARLGERREARILIDDVLSSDVVFPSRAEAEQLGRDL